MKIVVIGGTRLVGSKLVEKLSLAGHNALMASPATGVDTLTGEGLAFVLEDTELVVEVANAPNWGRRGRDGLLPDSSSNCVTKTSVTIV